MNTTKMTIAAAISALLVSGALAQTPNKTPNVASADSSAPAAQPAPEFVAAQKPDQWLASRFRGTDVMGADDKKIGDVTDILFDKTGKIEAFLVSVGGFVGVGAKEVALAPSAFEVLPGPNGSPDRLKISMSKDQLKEAQNFMRYEPPAVRTGGGPGGQPTGMRIDAPPAVGR
jgi:hypothetical protein